MNKLTEQELDNKIRTFLNERFSAHPEIAESKVQKNKERFSESVVSRVKNTFSKMQSNRSSNARTYYQI